jgi:hypothetical protein
MPSPGCEARRSAIPRALHCEFQWKGAGSPRALHCEILWKGAGSYPGRARPVFRLNSDADPSAHSEGSADPAPARLEGRQQVVQDRICHVFVKDTFVAIGPEIELERLRLEDPPGWDVLDSDRGEIRLPGRRADASELVALQPDQVRSLRVMVRERLKLPGRLAAAPEQAQPLEVRRVGHRAACFSADRLRTASHVLQNEHAPGALVGCPHVGQGWRSAGSSVVDVGNAPRRFASRKER